MECTRRVTQAQEETLRENKKDAARQRIRRAARSKILIGCVRSVSGEQAADGGGFRDAPNGENICCVAHVRVVFAAGFVHIGK
jgi:hypothetical protein